MNTELSFILTAGFALVFLVVAVFGWRKASRAEALLKAKELELAGQGDARARIAELREELEAEEAARLEAERRASALAQQVEGMKEQQAKQEKLIEEFKQAARASVLGAGQELSSKLLEDHRREAKAQREEQEKITKQATQKLFEDMQGLSKSVAALGADTQSNKAQMNTVMRALSNPSGAGQMSEIGLENALKNIGLVPNQDFFMQYHLESESGSKLRPDVVVLLPQDMVMVIDSKASHFMLKLAEAEGGEEEAAVMQRFVQSTRQHIDALGRKQYADEVAAILRQKGRKMGYLFNAMYIHSDSAIEKLRAADPALGEHCDKAGLFMVGPAGLSAVFSLARQQIATAKRDANQQQIVEQLGSLMGNLVTTLSHVDGMGRNIQNAAKKFGDFAKSMNRSVLPKLRQMEAMGVSPDKNKSLPAALAYYDVTSHAELLHGEAVEDAHEESAPAKLLEKESA